MLESGGPRKYGPDCRFGGTGAHGVLDGGTRGVLLVSKAFWGTYEVTKMTLW